MSPTYPSLWECETNHVSGMDDYVTYQGQPFMCKICQKVHKTYFPKELEKQAIIDENYYDIINGTQPGEGNLSLTLLNFKPDNIFLDIPIVINDDNLELIYNVSYYIKLRKPISVLIIEVGSSDKGNDSKISTGIAPEIFFIIISLIIISFIGAITSYQAIKRIIIKREEFRKKIFNKYMDVLNLNYIIVSDKNSGLCIYEQMISDKSINSTLVSGFLQAISSFGIELSGSDEQSQTIKLEYKKLKIIMSEYKNYRIINIFEDNPSEEFTEALGLLSHELDKNYGKFLENFDGELTQFKGINSLIEKHLQISLIYPLKIVLSDNLKLNKSEKSIVKKASDIMKKNNADHFYISYLITEREFNPKRAEIILKLIDKKVFQHTI